MNKMIQAGLNWYCDHVDHVHRLIENEPDLVLVQPSSEDALSPELWKACHWLWWFEMTKAAIDQLEEYDEAR